MTPFSATLRSEWTKLVSLRSTKVMIGSAVLLSLALTALLAIVVGETFDGWDAAAKRDFDPVDTALVGAIVTFILFLVLGVKAATVEYGSGMIRLTLAATPRRRRVLAAKVVVVAAITLVAAFVSTVGMLLTARAVLGHYGLATPSLTEHDAVRALLAGSLVAPQFPLIALTLGLALRSTAAAIVATLGIIFAPPFVGALLPTSWQGPLRYLPSAASDGLTGASSDALAPGLSAVVVVAWVAVFLGGAWALFEQRDA